MKIPKPINESLVLHQLPKETVYKQTLENKYNGKEEIIPANACTAAKRDAIRACGAMIIANVFSLPLPGWMGAIATSGISGACQRAATKAYRICRYGR